jgi:hypothetical protein
MAEWYQKGKLEDGRMFEGITELKKNIERSSENSITMMPSGFENGGHLRYAIYVALMGSFISFIGLNYNPLEPVLFPTSQSLSKRGEYDTR